MKIMKPKVIKSQNEVIEELIGPGYQSGLAKKVGTHQTQISKYLNGTEIPFNKLLEWADKTGHVILLAGKEPEEIDDL